MRIKYGATNCRFNYITEEPRDSHRLLPLSTPILYPKTFHSIIPAASVDSTNYNSYFSSLLSIEGNSEVVNQLVNYTTITTRTNYGITLTNNNNGSFTLNGTATGNAVFIIVDSTSLIVSHKYLNLGINNISGVTYRYFGGSYTGITKDSVVQYDGTSYTGNFVVFVAEGTTVNNLVFTPQLIDLTQEFPFDTPTSIDDPRVQNIIARGYILYNTGEIKNTVITEIEAEGFNIWDEETELIGNSLYNKNPIKVIPNTKYYFHINGNNQFLTIRAVDENNNSLGGLEYNLNNREVTIPSNVKYIGFTLPTSYGTTYNHDICINRSSSLNGQYRPYHEPSKIQLPAPVELAGVNTAKNKLTVTDEAYVFTRKSFDYTFTGNETYTSASYGRVYCNAGNIGIKDPPARSEKANALMTNFKSIDDSHLENGNMAISVWGSVFGFEITATATSSVMGDIEAVKSLIIGKTVTYELATPQVISIPKKHLGWAKLKDLNWTMYATNKFSANTSGLDIKVSTQSGVPSNMFHSSLITVGSSTTLDPNSKQITVQGNTLYVANNSWSSADDIDGILFFETQNEVQDFNDEMYVEAGGTVNGNLFSWNKNQLLHAQTTNTTVNGITIISNSDYKYTITVNNATGYSQIYLAQNLNIVSGHKYLMLGQDKINNTTGIEVYISGISAPIGKNYIFSPINNASVCFLYVGANTPNGTYAVIPNLIDLTIGFGAGNEPTDINDYRIQRIIELGYIPTDLVGVHTQETCEVLPDISTISKLIII